MDGHKAMNLRQLRGWVLLAAMCAGGTGPVAAQGAWVEFSQTATSTAFYDPSSIKPDPSRQIAYLAWWRSVLSTPNSVDGKPYSSHLALYRVDCLNRGLMQREMHYFSSTGVEVSTAGLGSEMLPMPDTLGDSFVKVVCARANR